VESFVPPSTLLSGGCRQFGGKQKPLLASRAQVQPELNAAGLVHSSRSLFISVAEDTRDSDIPSLAH
jgi:hypothetical protein